jgi:predicted transcriptional regulator
MRIPIPVRLPPDIVEWIDAIATEQGEPRSVILRQLLRAEMQRQRRSRRRSTTDAN